ncbi:MAG: phage protein Gp37 [Blastomonas fulva]|uniref:phage protein Gp37 n=1 Tax=Blastomonas fulva TaxID=1550728 RepID=UPI0040341BD6
MIAAIENAVLELLRDAGVDGRLGYQFKTLETYPDEWDAYLKDKRQLRCPGAWCVFLGMVSMDLTDDGVTYGLARFATVLAAENLRNEQATRHGGGGAIGSYQLGVDAVGLMAGNALGLDIGIIQPRRLALVGRSEETRKQGLSLIAFEWESRVPIAELIADGELADFETFHANWDVPPFGGIGPDLPDDEPADATDTVTLEGATP